MLRRYPATKPGRRAFAPRVTPRRRAMAQDGQVTSHPRARRASYAVVVLALLLGACSEGESSPRGQSSSDSAASSAPSPDASAPDASSAPAAADASVSPGVTAVPAPGTTTTGLPSQTSPTPISSAPPGAQAQRRSAAPGRYTMAVTGTFRTDTGEQPTNGEATLTVDPPTADDQHSTLEAGQSGSTEQTVRFTPSEIQLVQLRISSPGFSKEFRPVRPVLLLPQPATVGRTWRWTVVSTDGATSASLDAKVVRTETLTIGGEKVACVVVHSTLKLTGDLTATSVMDTWFAERYHLTAKEHSVTDGEFQGFKFHSDTTATLRSTKPA